MSNKKIKITNKYGSFIIIKRYSDETHFNEYYDIEDVYGHFIFRFNSEKLIDEDKEGFEKELENKLYNYINHEYN